MPTPPVVGRSLVMYRSTSTGGHHAIHAVVCQDGHPRTALCLAVDVRKLVLAETQEDPTRCRTCQHRIKIWRLMDAINRGQDTGESLPRSRPKRIPFG